MTKALETWIIGKSSKGEYKIAKMLKIAKLSHHYRKIGMSVENCFSSGSPSFICHQQIQPALHSYLSPIKFRVALFPKYL